MSTAVDFGTWQIKSLSRAGGRLIARGIRPVYSLLPGNEQWRTLLERLEIPHGTSDSELTVMGDQAAELQWLCRVPYVSLLQDGCVPRGDGASRQMLAALVDCVLPKALRPGEVCCITLPGMAYSVRRGDNPELDLLSNLVELRGYVPRVISAGSAAVLAEGADSDFSGIGLSFGATTCDASLVRKGVELAHVAVPIGGEWIDEQLAEGESDYVWDAEGVCYLDKSKSNRWKHSFTGSLMEPCNEKELFFRDLNLQMISDAVLAAAEKFSRTEILSEFSGPIDMICSGGSVNTNGFEGLMSEFLENGVSLPFAAGKCRFSEDTYATARGCLVNAEIESEMTERAPMSKAA